MKTEEIKELFEQFESIANEYEGIECWSARELCGLLGYSKWEKFYNVIEKGAGCVCKRRRACRGSFSPRRENDRTCQRCAARD